MKKLSQFFWCFLQKAVLFLQYVIILWQNLPVTRHFQNLLENILKLQKKALSVEVKHIQNSLLDPLHFQNYQQIRKKIPKTIVHPVLIK